MKTPPTIPSPLPFDHRLLRLAGMLGVSKREALGATVEAWAWIYEQAQDGVVPQPVAMLDGVTLLDGFGEAAVAVGLVGSADGVIVAPAELRQRTESPTLTGDKVQRRKSQCAAASRKYRRGQKLRGDKPKSAEPAPRRSLGYVDGHEVLAKVGPFGLYVTVAGATPGKLTASDDGWDFNTVTLGAALPRLLEKWKTAHGKEQSVWDKSKRKQLSPTYAALVQAADLEAAKRRQAPTGDESGPPSAHNDDASARHDDASSSVIKTSSSETGGGGRNSNGDQDLGSAGASSFPDDDALSSMSSSMSSSNEEDTGAEADGIGEGVARPADKGDAHRLANAEPGSNVTTSHEDAPGRPPGDETHVQASTKVQPSGGSLDASVTKPPRTPPSAGNDIEADPSPTRRSQRDARLEDAEQADRRNDILRAVAAFATTAPESVTHG
jgi:hypothetical protein